MTAVQDISQIAPLHINLKDSTLSTTCYRNVIYTLPNYQLVLMSIPPLSQIGDEVHHDHTQFVYVECGNGLAIINNVPYALHAGVAVVIPNGYHHNIINTDNTNNLKLFTTYSQPEHPHGLIQTA